MSIDADELKIAAVGRWREILVAVGGIAPEKLNGRNGPCPKCGGRDRYQAINPDQGVLHCRKCFSKGNGDGFAALAWLLDLDIVKDFPEVCRLTADHLGMIDQGSNSQPRTVDLIGRLASVKSCPRASLIEYGAEVDGNAVAFPVFGPDQKQCSTFSIWPAAPADSKQAKGLLAKGKPSGLFFPLTDGGATHFPRAGETWLIVEGVKDAAALHGLDYLAVGMNGDALPQKFVSLFQGVDVVIVPDRTTPAEAKARESAARLEGVAKSVKIAALPLPLDGDRGDDTRDALSQRDGEQLVRKCIDTAKPWNATSWDTPAGKSKRMDELVQAHIESLRENGQEPTVSLGIAQLDRTLGGGVRYGDLVVIGGLSSHMKSGFAQQIGHHVTRDLKLPFAFLSLEMAPDALAVRTIQYASDLPKEHWHHSTQRIEEDAKRHFKGAASFTVVEVGAMLSDVEREIKKLISKGTRIIVVDYAQLILTEGRDDPTITMRKVAGSMKQLAKSNDAIIILLAQLRKTVEERKPLVPRLTDIEYGPKLGQDSDVCLFVVWPHRVNPANPRHEYQIFLEKQRQGASKVAIKCRFDPPRLRISEEMPTPTPEEDFDDQQQFGNFKDPPEGGFYAE